MAIGPTTPPWFRKVLCERQPAEAGGFTKQTDAHGGHQIPLHDVARPASLAELRCNARRPGPPITGQTFVGTFRSGDLVYGTRETRAYYGVQLYPGNNYGSNNDTTPDGHWVYIDSYNNEIDELYNPFCRAGNSRQSGAELDLPWNARNGLARYKSFLEHDAHYQPQRTPGLLPEQIDLRFKRSCKAGILFTTIVRKRKIHFVLDEIDIDQVLSETHESTAARAFTGVELRKVYRMWGNRDVRSRVYFWDNGCQVLPPWQQEPARWDRYVPRRFRSISSPAR